MEAYECPGHIFCLPQHLMTSLDKVSDCLEVASSFDCMFLHHLHHFHVALDDRDMVLEYLNSRSAVERLLNNLSCSGIICMGAWACKSQTHLWPRNVPCGRWTRAFFAFPCFLLSLRRPRSCHYGLIPTLLRIKLSKLEPC